MTASTVLACQLATRAYPDGRTGTTAGYLAHFKIREAACEACLRAAADGQRAATSKLEPGQIRERRQAEYQRNRDRYTASNYRAKHGMTLEQYDDLLEHQGGGCAICGTTDPGGRWGGAGRFHLDHDHDCCPDQKSCSRCRRGLLCSPCNVALGAFGDDIDKLTAAIAYLLEHRGGADG